MDGRGLDSGIETCDERL